MRLFPSIRHLAQNQLLNFVHSAVSIILDFWRT
nr:MAG TPA: hypothetical protein [Caudoviricetes sp.]